MFLQVCVILFTGGCLHQCMLGCHTPRADTPQTRHPAPRSRHPLGADTPPPHPGSRHPLSRHPPEQTPPQSRHLQPDPPEQTPQDQKPPLGADTPPGSRLWHTVNERPVHILLECILVQNIFQKSPLFAHCLIWQNS